MASKETRRQRGRRRGLEIGARVLGELRTRRVTADLSLQAVADHLGCSQATAWRRERDAGRATIVGVSEMASVLGYEISIGLHPVGEPIRDKGQRAVGSRFDAVLASAWAVLDEAPFPLAGDQRAWDKLLRLIGSTPPYLVGTDLETRIRDIQDLVRRTRLRERDGGVEAILIVLGDSAVNRRLVEQLREALGAAYATSPRTILRQLRAGERLLGSGVLLI